MLRHALRGLTLALLVAAALTSPAIAGVTRISNCGLLDKAGETYILATDLTSTNVGCLFVIADRVTIDLAGHTISGRGLSDPFDNGIGVADRAAPVIKNGTIRDFFIGISLKNSPRATIRNVTVTGTAAFGIAVADGSVGALVKGCIVQDNDGTGVLMGGSGQLEGCLIERNRDGGVSGGDRLLITRNIVRENLRAGISVGGSSTLSYNEVSDNRRDGIVVGAHSLVTSNTSNDNDGDGINAVCPSTITNNTALENGGLPIDPPTSGDGCVILHNTTSGGGGCSESDSALAAC